MADIGHEFTAKNVDQAVEEGLSQLKLDRDEVEIEVLHEGSRGILGIGATDARVRITRRMPESVPQSAETASLEDEHEQHESSVVSEPRATAVADDPTIEADFDRVGQGESDGAPAPQEEIASASTPTTAQEEDLSAGADDDESDDDESEYDDEFDDFDDMEESETADIAYGLLAQMLDLMNIDAQIETSLEIQDDEDDATIHLNIVGADESSLIGRRGETLASIQYLVRLMVNQKLHQWTNIVIDVNGYKEQRAEKLSRMAMRMAEQVVETGQPVSLEPMPASERRLIHIALRDHPQVYTESTGQDDRRKVSILLK